MKLKELYENKAAFTDFDKWKAAVEKANPGKKLQFKGRVEGGKSTVSAEVKGEDRCYGVWDDDQNTGDLLGEGIAPPFTKFKKGQIVTVKKTGQKVEVLSQNDIGLVQTVKVGGGVPAFPKGKGSVVQGKDHQEYMPRELE